MTRYIYGGPYSALEIDDHGTRKLLFMNQATDIEDDAFVMDQMRRGFHLFFPVDENDSPIAAPEPTPEPEPVAEPEPVDPEPEVVPEEVSPA